MVECVERMGPEVTEIYYGHPCVKFLTGFLGTEKFTLFLFLQ